MLLLLFTLSFIAMVVFILLALHFSKNKRFNHDVFGRSELFIVLSVVSTVITVIFIISICICSYNIATENILEEKIVMYQEENAKIEAEIDQIVNTYLSHEKDTLTALKAENTSIAIATLYPELNSNELVQNQINIHNSNNSNIKALKLEKLNIKKTKWLLYFGK